MMKKKALIAMSGGVDSSVAAWLMKEQGFDCIGAMMKLYDQEDGTCGTLENAKDAKDVADRLGIPFQLLDFSEDFQREVIGRFVDAYEHGRTPNPCVDCNRHMKFDRLYQAAREMGCDYIVTGHYVQIREDENGRFRLFMAEDPAKDQSYVLYSLTQEQLSHARFPLGSMTKSQVRRIAEEQGFLNAHKQESQDICFVQSGKYAEFIQQYTGRSYPPGNFIDAEGKILGTHKGIIRYTIGQRKGLGIALGEPMFVTEVNPGENTVRLGRNEELFTTTLDAEHINLIPFDHIDQPLRLTARIRYQARPAAATVTQDGDHLHLVFDLPQRAITPGQSVVLYDGQEVIGGGKII